jgi:hypothetical protein
MDRIATRLRTALLIGGLGLAAFAAEPAAAQFACPVGYYYAPVYGCVLPHEGYFAPDPGYVPPVYGWFGYPHVRGWDHGWHDHGDHRGGRGIEHGHR